MNVVVRPITGDDQMIDGTCKTVLSISVADFEGPPAKTG
jgi:hypothetical protein